jgi:hypothetical protein
MSLEDTKQKAAGRCTAAVIHIKLQINNEQAHYDKE